MHKCIPLTNRKTSARQHYHCCYNNCPNHETSKLSGRKGYKRKTICPSIRSADFKLLFNLFSVFIQLISEDETPIPKWGMRLLGGEGGILFFRMVLVFFLFILLIFYFSFLPSSPVLICPFFSITSPSIFQDALHLFSAPHLLPSRKYYQSTAIYLHSNLSFLLLSLGKLLPQSHGTHSCN